MKSRTWSIGRYERISQIFALLAVLLSIAALARWFAGFVTVTGLPAPFIPMAPNAALMFLLLGMSVALREKSRILLLATRVAVAITATLAITRLSVYLTNLQLRVEHWFFTFPHETVAAAPIGQMAFSTALTFVLLSTAIFLFTLSHPRWVNDAVKALSIVVGFIGLAFLLGYFYGAPLMYDGRWIPMAMTAAICFFLLGAGLVVRASVRDITERRSVQEALQKAHEELEQRVLERTAALSQAVTSLETEAAERKQAEQALRETEEQLRQSQKLEGVGQLAGGIAHDFNNLLTVITGYSDLLLIRHSLDDVAREKIQEIKSAGVRATSLTRQLLAFSRKQVLQPVVLDVNTLVEGIGKMLERLIGEHIEVTTLLRPGVAKINADPGQIEQVLINLVVNARDAMPIGGRIAVETANVELDSEYAKVNAPVKPGRYVMLSVTDNGTGMDSETQQRIFEPFFTTKEVGKGTGLGLSTVYGIVKQSGGSISMHSEVGKGTTFKIYLPRADDQCATPVSRQDPLEPINGTETILVVEDEEMVRKLAREVLDERGYRVLEAANGDEAIKICHEYENPIHLVLTDVVMPGMSGREVAQAIKTAHPEAAVLYMSGYTDDAIVRHGVLEPGINFIEKPFTSQALVSKVMSVLKDGGKTVISR